MEERMKEPVNKVLNCYRVCLDTHTRCIQMGKPQAEPMHVSMLMDCIKVCALSADYMTRGSDNHKQACALCADICDSCASSCEKFSDDFLKECARVCKDCSGTCREMAK